MRLLGLYLIISWSCFSPSETAWAKGFEILSKISLNFPSLFFSFIFFTFIYCGSLIFRPQIINSVDFPPAEIFFFPPSTPIHSFPILSSFKMTANFEENSSQLKFLFLFLSLSFFPSSLIS